MSDLISREELRKMVAGWMAAGKRIIGPVQLKPGLIAFTPLNSADALWLDGWVRPSNSIKEAVFPRHEVLFRYRVEKDRIELMDAAEAAVEQIIIGAHPCDAAALPILDKVFNWDYADEFYSRRRAATTVVTLACTSHDEECFCTSLGLGPAAVSGSDAMLFDAGDGSFHIRAVTEKGEALFGKTSAGETACPTQDQFEPVFDAARVGAFAREHFDDPFWKEHALACLGCGACAYTCPVCHCFDIVDETHGPEGIRARNWDACQFPMFTLHASGHNPRPAQGERQRQRLYHKFFVYPEKFGEILCTGCGNCARNCPVGLGILPLASEIRDAELVQA